LSVGCVRKVKVAEELPVRPDISTEDLIKRINSYAEVETFLAQTDIYVRNYFTGVGDKADEYPSASGLLRLQRPENIRMYVSFYSARVADMVTDGKDFKVAIYRPESKRRFIYGSNLQGIDRLDESELKALKDPQLKEAGGLANMRPQHITDAFLIKPVMENEKTAIFREEVRQEETLQETNKKKRQVVRTYAVIYVLERSDEGQFFLRRKFWFDRTTVGSPLVRQQTFENGIGKLASDIIYEGWLQISGSSLPWPQKVSIDRHRDGYRLEIRPEMDSIEVNGELPGTTFVLENTEGLPEVDLDKPRKASIKPEPMSATKVRY
jgi:hypothetical protein